MAARVYNQRRAERTQFRKLPLGKLAWPATDVTLAPTMKYDRSSTLVGYSKTTGKPTTTTSVTGTADPMIKVPGGFLRR